MRSRFVWLSAASLFLGAGAVANVAGFGVESMDEFSRENPRAGLYLTGQRVTSVYGPAFSTGLTAEASVNAFLGRHADVFGVTPDELVMNPERNGAAPIGLMPDGQGGFKFTLFNLRHDFDGVPVFRSELKMLVRNEEGFPLVLARSSLRSVAGLVVDRAVAANPNIEMAKMVALAAHPNLNNFLEPSLVIFAGDENQEAPPRLAVQFVASGGSVRGGNFDQWLFVCDAATGQVLLEEKWLFDVDLNGSVSGLATDGAGSDACHPEVSMGMPYARVQVGATTVFADAMGNYVVPNVAGGAITATASIANGEFFRVLGSTALNLNTAAPGPADFLFNSANTEFPRSEVNCYLHANVIRDLVLDVSPGYPLNVGGGMAITVNINDSCNAFYDPQGQNINFFRAAGGCPNTGFSSVVYHEYGHHLVSTAGSGQGQYGEGTGDCMSVLILDDPILGRGWSGSCSSGLRSALNNMQYPCSTGSHACAPLLSASVWATRNELFATNPSDYLDILQTLFVNSILLHTGSNITPQITIDLITLDDNDADILNGAPHYHQINDGFGAHNMATGIANLEITYPDGLPNLIPPQGADLAVLVKPNLGNTIVESSIAVMADIDDDGDFEALSGAVDSVGPDGVLYIAEFPGGLACGDDIPFFATAETALGAVVTDPAAAPGTSLHVAVATEVSLSFEDDFEANLGWTVGATGDNATTGVWGRLDPVGTVAQPENDFDNDGTLCFVTGNATPGAGEGTNDVDGGTTTVTSPAMDATAGPAAYISYARWYSNHSGASPNADTFVIQISNNGTTWVALETVGPAGPEVSGGWFFKRFRVDEFVTPTSTVQVRFRASDLGSGSIVEAAVDAVSMEIYDCAIVDCPGDLNGDLVVDFGDLNILLDNYNETGSGLAGDFDEDGDVDFDDLNALLNLYGTAC